MYVYKLKPLDYAVVLCNFVLCKYDLLEHKDTL